jgi:anti-sigma regulatory factor (Ser/Thr protein kinase)
MKRRDGKESLDEITRPARKESAAELVEFVTTQAWEGGFDDDKIKNIGLAIAEAIDNIVRFSCADGSGEITIKCEYHDAPALLIDVIDTGEKFNMLLAGAFPETQDFMIDGQLPSLKALKKAVKNIEYRRDAKQLRNILALVIPK